METLLMFITVLRLSPGRRIQVYRKMRPLAEALRETGLVAHIDKAMSHDAHTRLTIDRHKHGGRNAYAGPVGLVDGPADRMLSGLYAMIKGAAAGLPPRHPLTIMSEELIKDTFPNGPGAITHLPYSDQVVAMENLVTMLTGEHAERVAKLGLAVKLSQLAEITLEYRRLVDLGTGPNTAPDVRAANRRGHGYMSEVVSIILGTYFDSENPAHVTTREKLLAPLIEQIEIVRLTRRARRSPGDDDLSTAPPDTDDQDGDMDGDLDDMDGDLDDMDGDLDDSDDLNAPGALDSEPAAAPAR
jgi:hypothetical protein